MINWSKKIVFVCLLLVLSGFTFPGKVIQFGGEIPWPLSNQRPVSESSSKGLWDLESYGTRKMFNVEIVSEKSGYDWIRVAEIDPHTYEVLSWGEGIFRQVENVIVKGKKQSSFFDLNTKPGSEKEDTYGRYITMFPNGDFTKQPYVIRLVEVKTSLGHVLGLSIIHYIEQTYEHLLGRRVLGTPLECDNTDLKEERLSCFLD